MVGEAQEQGCLQSCHDLSDGGLAVAVAECCFGRDTLGADLDLGGSLPGELLLNALLFSESHSRFVVSVAPEDEWAFESIFEARATRIGVVTGGGELRVRHAGQKVISVLTTALRNAWTNGPVNRLLSVGADLSAETHHSGL